MALSESTPASASTLAFLALLGGGVAVGFSPIFARLSDLAPLASGFYRLAFAVPAIWLATQASRGELQSPSTLASGDRIRLALAGFALCRRYRLLASGHCPDHRPRSDAPRQYGADHGHCVSVLFFGEKLKPLFIIGVAIALAGVATLALQRTGAVVTPPNRFIGGIFALLAASFFAAYLLLVADVRRQCSTGTIMFYTTLVSALAMLPFAFALSPTILSGSLDGWLILLALAVISHAGGQGLMTFALAHLPTSFSSMMGLMQTAVAAILAWILLSEPLTLIMLASGAAILAGIWSCRKATAG
jgi:drug/metabolite transporter (DMT)-like permease